MARRQHPAEHRRDRAHSAPKGGPAGLERIVRRYLSDREIVALKHASCGGRKPSGPEWLESSLVALTQVWSDCSPRQRYEDSRYGLPAHRPPNAGDDPGTTPPRAEPTPSGPAQKRDNETHRPWHYRRCGSGTARDTFVMSGAGAKPAGKRLATDKRHRVDMDQGVKGLPLQVGGKERGPDIV